MKKLPNKQRSAREKHYEQLYLKELAAKNEWYEKYEKEHQELLKANTYIKELEFFQHFTPEEMEDVKIAIKKISDFQGSSMGQLMGSSFMPILSSIRALGRL